MNKIFIIGSINMDLVIKTPYMPVAGEIIEINERLINSPELINESAFEEWLVKVKPKDFQEDSQGLIDYNDYKDEI